MCAKECATLSPLSHRLSQIAHACSTMPVWQYGHWVICAFFNLSSASIIFIFVGIYILTLTEMRIIWFFPITALFRRSQEYAIHVPHRVPLFCTPFLGLSANEKNLNLTRNHLKLYSRFLLYPEISTAIYLSQISRDLLNSASWSGQSMLPHSHQISFLGKQPKNVFFKRNIS